MRAFHPRATTGDSHIPTRSSSRVRSTPRSGSAADAITRPARTLTPKHFTSRAAAPRYMASDKKVG
jgi:hypothetical protein